jgi:polar amino acid transport system substrate-binding protein
MRVKAISVAAAACLCVGATGVVAAGGASARSARASGTAAAGNIAAGVKPDPAAVKLLPATVKQRGYIADAMQLAYPPTSFLSASHQPEGFNVDIARLIAAKLGLKLKIDNVSFDTIIPGLTGGRYDFTTTDMSATAARLKVLDMVNYWNAGSSLGTKAGNPEHLNINNTSICGKSIAVMTGSTQQQLYIPYLSQKCKADGKATINAVILPDVNTALTQLASGRIDGIFYDTDSLAWAAKQASHVFAVAKPQFNKPKKFGIDVVAIGLPKHSGLTKPVQLAMQSIMNSPLYMKALNKWGLGAGAIKRATIATSPAN